MKYKQILKIFSEYDIHLKSLNQFLSILTSVEIQPGIGANRIHGSGLFSSCADALPPVKQEVYLGLHTGRSTHEYLEFDVVRSSCLQGDLRCMGIG
jgi:hypothetical protein